ncbi:MAG: D-alanine--D-alanine ligase [Phaeodactylibacter sp.]|nr:D-alanine--D-alanine ligase [Phaeodactylibacter sp.]MCB9275010.1 D-alanine--D-alanine ligase [Lewinellaceae bacterium]
MNKLNVAIVTGGDVAERSISLQSAATVFKHLDANKYDKYIIELNQGAFTEQGTGAPVDMNDFSLHRPDGIVRFGLIFLMIHGHPAEDGCMQGYFQLLGIPYTGCNHFVSALTFDKQACKDFLKAHDIPMAPSRLLRKGQPVSWQELLDMGLPLFVKPNKNGSSYGVSKVKTPGELEPAVALSFQFDDEVVVEGFLNGVEFSNGVVRKDGETLVLPITEIVPQNEFFDFKAKYENESQEITPARLTAGLWDQCQAQTKKIYEVLGCRGMARIDYILVDGTFYFLEANTIPGMSEASIIPQQAHAHGWTIAELLETVAEDALAMVKQQG